MDDALVAAARRLLILEHELWQLGKRMSSSPEIRDDDTDALDTTKAQTAVRTLEAEADLLRLLNRVIK